jgi:hypothetical protein
LAYYLFCFTIYFVLLFIVLLFIVLLFIVYYFMLFYFIYYFIFGKIKGVEELQALIYDTLQFANRLVRFNFPHVSVLNGGMDALKVMAEPLLEYGVL